MADTGIFATTAEVQRKVGANASATSNVEAYINQYMTEAESQINVETNHNWSDAYTGLDADVKGILKMAASNLAAIFVIEYDMGAIGISEAQARIDVLRDWYVQAIKLLRERKAADFIIDPTKA